MLALTRKTEYALIALGHLARGARKVCSAREIADRYHMPLPVLVNILKALAHDGIVESVRGARGGYRLALDAVDISLKRMITALEGPVHLVPCTAAGPEQTIDSLCDIAHWCPVISPVRKVHELLAEFLERVTLAEIAEDFPVQFVGVQLPAPARDAS
jgi:Rrf2 family protein